MGAILLWHIFTPEEHVPAAQLSLGAAGLLDAVRVYGLEETVRQLSRRGVVPMWAWPAWQTWLSDAGHPERWQTEISLREFPSSRDPKHAHPLNLLRLYLSEVSALRHLDRVLLVDDDVLFQRDVARLFDVPLLDGELLRASCDMYTPVQSGGEHWLELAHASHTYADTHFIGSVGARGYAPCEIASTDGSGRAHHPCAPAGLEPLLSSLYTGINGEQARTPLRRLRSWNFGVALLPLARWREQQLADRVRAWFEASLRYRLFTPDSVASGLGLPYLIFAGSVSCWERGTVLDGLGFVGLDDLAHNGIDERRLADFPAVHFAGPSKLDLSDLAVDSSPAAIQGATLRHLSHHRRALSNGHGGAYGGIYGYGGDYYSAWDLSAGPPPPSAPPSAPPPPSASPSQPPPSASPAPPLPPTSGASCKAGLCTGNVFETCFYDPGCAAGGLGCNAGGKTLCRFCEFGAYEAIKCAPCSGASCRCLTESCTQSVLGSLAGPHACGERIVWLERDLDLSEAAACHRVAEEFPEVCGACDPPDSGDSDDVGATSPQPPSASPSPPPGVPTCEDAGFDVALPVTDLCGPDLVASGCYSGECQAGATSGSGSCLVGTETLCICCYPHPSPAPPAPSMPPRQPRALSPSLPPRRPRSSPLYSPRAPFPAETSRPEPELRCMRHCATNTNSWAEKCAAVPCQVHSDADDT